jgi:diphthine methyl ester acylhydrolase
MNEERSISSICSLSLDLPPSCVEFCPSNPTYFVVGTYNLEKKAEVAAEHASSSDDDIEGAGSEVNRTQSRNGSLILFNIEKEDL